MPKLLDDETPKKKMTDAEPTLEVLSERCNSPVVPFDSEKRAAAFCADALAESSACAESAAAAVVTIKKKRPLPPMSLNLGRRMRARLEQEW